MAAPPRASRGFLEQALAVSILRVLGISGVLLPLLPSRQIPGLLQAPRVLPALIGAERAAELRRGTVGAEDQVDDEPVVAVSIRASSNGAVVVVVGSVFLEPDAVRGSGGPAVAGPAEVIDDGQRWPEEAKWREREGGW